MVIRGGEMLKFVHLPRSIAASWRGWPFSGVRGTSHQIALDFTTQGAAPVSFETPGYGLVLIDEECVIVHFTEVGAWRWPSADKVIVGQ